MNTALQLTDDGLAGLLRNIERGEFIQAVEEQLRDLVAAISVTDKKGKIALEIDIEPNKKLGAVEVTGKVKVTLPKEPRRASLFYVTPDNFLSRLDPKQRELFEEREERIRMRADTGTAA